MPLINFLLGAFVLVTWGSFLLVLLYVAVSVDSGSVAFIACVLALVPAAILCVAFWPGRSKDDEDGDSPLDVRIKLRRAGRGEYDATVTPRRRHAP